MTLTEFLLARIAEDEGHARKLLETDRRPVLSLASTVNHPARLLAECEAKLRIVDWHLPDHLEPDICTTCASYAEDYPCRTIRALALPYADHADFDESWRL